MPKMVLTQGFWGSANPWYPTGVAVAWVYPSLAG